MRLKTTAAIGSAAVLFAVAACGGGGDDDDSNTRPSSGASQDQGSSGNAGADQDPEAQAPAPDIEGATAGGTVTVLSAVQPATLDPTRAYYTDSTAIMSGLVTRSLTQYVYRDGKMVLVPDMATDLGQPNEDLTEWTFTLREGLKYDDGTDVVPEDIAYAIKRSFAIAELPDGPTYNTTFFLDGDKYKGPFSDKSEYKGVVIDGMDITIKMRRPFGDMPYLASFPAFTAIPEAKDDPEAYGRDPLATGPYKFEEYTGDSLTLTRNEHWDPATDPGRHAYPDEWVFRFGEDTTTLENVLINDQGEAQTTLTYDSITGPGFQTAQQDGIVEDRLVKGTSPCTYMWYLDMTKITDMKVRQAIGYAYPYQDHWKAIGEIEGLTRLGGSTILPPGTSGRVEYDVLGNKGVETDPEKAKALLKEAGQEGYEIKFLYARDDELAVAGKDALVQGFEEAGFKMTPIASTTATIRDDRTDPKSPINVRSSGWCSDWPSGGSWFPAQWDGELVGVEGMPNPSNFKEADVDAEIDRILDTLSGEEANKAWGELDKMIEEKYYPAVVTGYSAVAALHGSKIGGMEVDNVRGMPTLQDIYITQ
jgi:peptide/nickel transport system substrate-binding protein